MIHLFGERLKELRINKKNSQEEIGKVLGVTKATISNWENGKGCPVGDELKKLAKHFGVSVDYLLGFNQEDHEKMERLRVALLEAGINDIDTAMQIISALKDK